MAHPHPEPEPTTVGITVRLSPEQIAQIDAHAIAMAARADAGVVITRTDAIRNLLLVALERR